MGDAIVLADLPLLLDAQDLVEIDAQERGEGRALDRRLDSEAGVVGRQIAAADEGVGRLDRDDPGEPQLLGQSVLQRLKSPLGAPARLR